jgi:hypothetical protein
MKQTRTGITAQESFSLTEIPHAKHERNFRDHGIACTGRLAAEPLPRPPHRARRMRGLLCLPVADDGPRTLHPFPRHSYSAHETRGALRG